MGWWLEGSVDSRVSGMVDELLRGDADVVLANLAVTTSRSFRVWNRGWRDKGTCKGGGGGLEAWKRKSDK